LLGRLETFVVTKTNGLQSYFFCFGTHAGWPNKVLWSWISPELLLIQPLARAPAGCDHFPWYS